MEPITAHFGTHLIYLGSGVTLLAVIAHAVNTFPTPKNPYGAWFLGVIQYAVGQRQRGTNTLEGKDTESTSAPIK